jgi:hypothetical protein
MNRVLAVLSLMVLVAASGCTKKDEEGSAQETKPGSEPAATSDDGTGDRAGKSGAVATTPVSGPMGKLAERKVELLPEPRERRIHPDQAVASSFLWNDWNRFQENYHPLYLVDDDPRTAWVEGAKGNGEGEWVRLPTNDVHATTRVRLRLRNGYHKSKSLFEKNGRARKLTVELLPSGTKKSFELSDSMDWAEMVVDQPEGLLTAIQLTVDTVYPGSRYQDLCLSDLEIFVTAKNIENPDFEKAKLEQVRAWKKERVEAAKFFASKAAKASPLLPGYRVEKGPTGPKLPWNDDPNQRMAQLIDELGNKLEGRAAELERARQAYASGFAGWTNVRLAPKIGNKIPAVDGLQVPDAYELYAGWTGESSFRVPLSGKLALYGTRWLASFDAAKPVTIASVLTAKASGCDVKDGVRYYYFEPPRTGEGRHSITDLLVVACGQAAERDGYYGFGVAQLLQYDQAGQLVALYDIDSVTALTWSDAGKLVGGERVQRVGNRLQPTTMKPRQP